MIELLVAASLFLAASMAFGYLLKTGLTSIAAAGNLNRAVYVLQAKMEEMRVLPFEELSDLNGCSFAEGKGRISVVPVLADLMRIKLELKWDPDRSPLTFYTLRSKYQ